MTVVIHSIKTVDDALKVRAAAAHDNHLSICPSHWFEKDGEIVGQVSAASIPTFMFWAHTKKVTKREALDMVAMAHEAMWAQGLKEWIALCPQSSPFYKHLDRLGYSVLGSTDMAIKRKT